MAASFETVQNDDASMKNFPSIKVRDHYIRRAQYEIDDNHMKYILERPNATCRSSLCLIPKWALI